MGFWMETNIYANIVHLFFHRIQSLQRDFPVRFPFRLVTGDIDWGEKKTSLQYNSSFEKKKKHGIDNELIIMHSRSQW